jgi:hypothetical protein
MMRSQRSGSRMNDRGDMSTVRAPNHTADSAMPRPMSWNIGNQET